MATFEKRVVASTDDTIRRLTTDWWDLTYATIIVGYLGATNKQLGGGMRFTNVTIAQGVTITSAYLTLTAQRSDAGINCNTKISAEDVDDAVTFADNAAAFDTRYANHTTAIVDWNDIVDWTAESEYNSPEIKTVIQEIVNRGSWASGNALVIFWEDFGDNSTPNAGSEARICYSYDGSTTKCPLLHIEYTVAVGRSFGFIIG